MANWYAGNNSTDSGNNTGWFFAAPSANTLTLVLDDIAVAATGNTTHNGTISVVLEDVSIAANGSLVHAGTLGLTLDDLTAAISGVVVHNGSLSVSLADIDPIFTGSIGHSGSLAIQLDDVSIVISGAGVLSGEISVLLDDVAIQIDGTINPPAPTTVITKGGTSKRTKNYKNQIHEVEEDVAKAINKVLGVEDQEPSISDFDSKNTTEIDYTGRILELALEAEINALGQSIEDYQSAMAQAELDDEEAILLLL